VLGRQHVRDGVATLRTEKSQREIVVNLPILPVLQRTLDAGPTSELAFICGKNGKPLTKESFGNQFNKTCREAGLLHGSAHGVRKIAAARAAERGATVAQLEAIFGWKGGRMASLYTEAADRKQLALDAMHTLANEKGKSIPSPEGKVRGQSENRNEDKMISFKWWGRQDSNLRRHSQRIYSLSPVIVFIV
jgi:integrase